MDHVAHAIPLGRIDDRFELLEEAGTGGMGTVYRARDHTTGGLVALKVLAPTESACVERFERERSILAELSHPGIVGYVASGTTEDDEPYLAMQWLEGESLAQRLAKGPLEWRDAAELGRRVAGALSAAHARGVVHRDLKPSNLFLVGGDPRGVVVLDFGIARLKSPHRGLTETGTILGTPGYMAPEQARGKKDVDERADLFALGCVLYRAIAGEQPFGGDDVLAIFAKLALEDPPRLTSAPPALDALVFRLLAKAPENRPRSAREVEDELEKIVEGQVDLPPTRPDRAPKIAAPKKRRWAFYALAPLPLLALALGFWLTREQIAPRTDLRPTCREWANALAQAQLDDGSFGMERHRETMMWATGQILFGLGRSRVECRAPGRAPLAHGAQALVRMRVGRWGGGSAPQTPSVVWAALASHALGDALGDRALRAQAVEARAMILPAQRSDGGFRYWIEGDPSDEANAYSTVMAAWALADLERSAPDDRARRARVRAAAWLRRALDEDLGEPPLRSTAGLADQAIYVLLLSRELGDRPAGDDALFTRAARAMIERCELGEEGCQRGLFDNDATRLEPEPNRGPTLITFWHPWTTLAARRLLASDLELPDDVRRSLDTIVRWGERQMADDADGITTAPAYQLGEYVIVAAELQP